MFFFTYNSAGSVVQRGHIPDTFSYSYDENGAVSHVAITTQVPPAPGELKNLEVTEAQYLSQDPVMVVNGTLTPDLGLMKKIKGERIDQWKLEANAAGFQFKGKTIQADSDSRADIATVSAQVSASGTFPIGWPGGWKAADNTMVSITTLLDWAAFVSAMSEQGTANYTKAQILKNNLAQATTAAQIDAIVWS